MKTISTLIVMAVTSVTAMAQSITGKVMDENNSPLSGKATRL